MKSAKKGSRALRIVSLDGQPVDQLPVTSAQPGGKGAAHVWLPVYAGQIAGLPKGIDGMIIASDLQGTSGHMAMGEASDKQIGAELAEWLPVLLEATFPALQMERVLVLLCGDLYGDPAKRGSSGDPLPVWTAFRRSFQTVIGVAGNHDLFTPEGVELLKNTPGIDCYDIPKIAEHRGIKAAGLGGVIGRADKPNRMPEADYLGALHRLLRSGPELLMLHQGPDVPSRQLPGEPGIRQVLERMPPLLVACGHVHWEQPLAELDNGTQVINADGRVYILARAAEGGQH